MSICEICEDQVPANQLNGCDVCGRLYCDACCSEEDLVCVECSTGSSSTEDEPESDEK